MIYSIVGTEIEKRARAYKELEALGKITTHIYSENVSILKPLVSASSLFGEKVVVNLIQVMDTALSRDELISLLPEMESSSNIFIIDEPFADANRVKRLEKFSKKIFDTREDKKIDNGVFELCNLFAKRDKKNAWVSFLNVCEKETPEAIHGALWWKFSNIWKDTKEGRPTKFTLIECEKIGSKIVRSSAEAHRGERDLKKEIEAIILSL